MKLGFLFVPFPREIWTDNIELSQSEFRLLGWFCCNLKLGFQQLEFSDDQIINGTSIGGYIYPPVGLSRNSMQKARTELVEKEMLVAKQVAGGGGRGKTAVWSYSLNLSDVEMNSPQTSQELTLKLSNFDKNEGVISRYRESTDNTLFPPSSGDDVKTTKPKKEQDPRHTPFRKTLEGFWIHLNQDTPAPSWSAKDAGQLGSFLKSWPTLDRETFIKWLKNYGSSENFNSALLPYQYLPKLHDYMNGPLNKFRHLEDSHAQA